MEIRLQYTAAPANAFPALRQSESSFLLAAYYRRRPPLFLFDPHNTKLGAGFQSAARIRKVLPTFQTVKNARLIGQRLVVGQAGDIVLDDMVRAEADAAQQMRRFCDRSSSLHHEDTDIEESDGKYFSNRLDRIDKRIDRPTLSLLSLEPSNFGSWLFRVLPKLAFLSPLGGNAIAVACWCPATWQRELLHFFGVTDEQIIDVNFGLTYEFRELHVPVCLNPNAYLGDETLEFFARALERNRIRQKREKLIYLSRLSHAKRRKFANVRYFMDEPELIDRLESKGFDIIEPEKHSIAQQIALFADARLVIGASGAGMFNTVFCPAGAGVLDMEAFPNWLYAHCNYFASCGHTYALAFGVADSTDLTPGSHKRWSIDVPGLIEKIEALRSVV